MCAQDTIVEATNVPDVERQTQQRMIKSTLQLLKLMHCVDEHARFGLKTEAHVACCRVIEHVVETFRQPIPEFAVRRTFAVHRTFAARRGVVGRSRPQRDAVRGELRSDIDGGFKELNAPTALLGG